MADPRQSQVDLMVQVLQRLLEGLGLHVMDAPNAQDVRGVIIEEIGAMPDAHFVLAIEPPEEPEEPAVLALPPPEQPSEKPRTAEEEWAEVRAELVACHNDALAAKMAEEASFARLDAFLTARGEKAKELAGGFIGKVANRRLCLQAMEAKGAELRERRRAEQEAAHLAKAMQQVQRESERRVTELQQRLKEAQRRAGQAPTPECHRSCPVCGHPGVARGRECPLRSTHTPTQLEAARQRSKNPLRRS